MKLRNIEIVGFKSFRDKVSVDLSDGMTCIVGPNGCGKSNVVDAIKWAMGDMSPKSLRGAAMSDVIFAGTEKRKPSGMAEVTLTFENELAGQTSLDGLAEEGAPEGGDEGGDGHEDEALDAEKGEEDEQDEQDWAMGDSIPREFQELTEIAITRRLHRSGESEYLINKTSCRLRDIQNLLAGTGLGKQGYSIIEQGQIGFIVNARPSERRLIIEEASGITRYKDQRKRAARKLDRTEQNLMRTRDILDEIEKQMKSLESQAEKAREHKRLSEELHCLEVALLLARRSEAAEKAAKLEKRLSAARREEAQGREKLEKVEKHLKRARVDAHQADKRHADLTENFYKVETRLNLAQSNREHAIETREGAEERRREVRIERQRQKERRIELGAELKEAREELEAVRDRPDQGGEEVTRLEKRLSKLKDRRREAARRRDELRRQVEGHRQQIRRTEDRLQWIEGQLQELASRRQSGADELAAVKEEAQGLERSISRLLVDGERKEEEVEHHRQKVAGLEKELEQAREKVQQSATAEEKLARRAVELQTRVDSLEKLRARGEGYAKGVQRVLEWAEEEGRDDVLGPVGDFLQVPQGQESAYAAVLGPRIGDILVADRRAALAALDVLTEDQEGRVACFPVPHGMEPRELVSTWVEGVEIVESLGDAPAASETTTQGIRAWATINGDVLFADGRIVGGSTGDQAETVLRQVRELEALREELAGVKARHEEAAEELDLFREDFEIFGEQLESARRELNDTAHAARGINQELEGEHRQKERVSRRLEQLEGQFQKLDAEKERLENERRELLEKRENLIEGVPQTQDELDEATGAVQGLDEEVETLGGQLTEKKVQVAKVDERKRHLEANVKRLKKASEHAEEQIDRLAREVEEQTARGDEARVRADALASEVERLDKTHKKLKVEVEEARSQLDEANERSKSLELGMLGVRQDLEEAQKKVQTIQMGQQEARLAVEHATEQLEEQFELDLAQARRRAMEVETPPEQRKGRAEYLKNRLRRIGEVNALAIEEFEEAKERYAFQSEQQADLEESVADLRAAIDRMDLESRKRFAETFEAVNEKFQTVFPRLFRGGNAELILTDPSNMLETGVDIEVQPPGKKVQNVTLLSGGEKALTAVSLIFSIFLLKPTPFAVLDEVDAPLDEANVGRFADMVHQLSRTSQMIVITHNRRTMEAPERLYGVTMEEAGVSKVVSVEMSDVDDRMAS